MALNEKRFVFLVQVALIATVLFGFSGPTQAKVLFFKRGAPQSFQSTFDLSLWENGRLNHRVKRTWALAFEVKNKKIVSGSLHSRTIWVSENNEIGASEINQHHTTAAGTLKIFKADMDANLLVFELRYEDGGRLPVCIRLRPLTDAGSFLEVVSFDARQVVASYFSDSLVSQEWRIPANPYDGTPLLQSEQLITASGVIREDGIDAMPEADKKIFGNVLMGGECMDQMKQLRNIPGWSELDRKYRRLLEKEKNNAAPESLAVTRKQREQAYGDIKAFLKQTESNVTIFKGIADCLEKSGMSPEGRKAATAFLMAILYSI